MGTITDKLNKLSETKSNIKNAIINKGVQVLDTDPFAIYPQKISEIKGEAGLQINGAVDVEVTYAEDVLKGDVLALEKLKGNVDVKKLLETTFISQAEIRSFNVALDKSSITIITGSYREAYDESTKWERFDLQPNGEYMKVADTATNQVATNAYLSQLKFSKDNNILLHAYSGETQIWGWDEATKKYVKYTRTGENLSSNLNAYNNYNITIPYENDSGFYFVWHQGYQNYIWKVNVNRQDKTFEVIANYDTYPGDIYPGRSALYSDGVAYNNVLSFKTVYNQEERVYQYDISKDNTLSVAKNKTYFKLSETQSQKGNTRRNILFTNVIDMYDPGGIVQPKLILTASETKKVTDLTQHMFCSDLKKVLGATTDLMYTWNFEATPTLNYVIFNITYNGGTHKILFRKKLITNKDKVEFYMPLGEKSSFTVAQIPENVTLPSYEIVSDLDSIGLPSAKFSNSSRFGNFNFGQEDYTVNVKTLFKFEQLVSNILAHKTNNRITRINDDYAIAKENGAKNTAGVVSQILVNVTKDIKEGVINDGGSSI